MTSKLYTECINDNERRRWLAENSEPNERDIFPQLDLLRASLASCERTIKTLRATVGDRDFEIATLNGALTGQTQTIAELRAELEATRQ